MPQEIDIHHIATWMCLRQDFMRFAAGKLKTVDWKVYWSAASKCLLSRYVAYEQDIN